MRYYDREYSREAELMNRTVDRRRFGGMNTAQMNEITELIENGQYDEAEELLSSMGSKTGSTRKVL